ncbi:hypothetical protein SAMN05661091_4431 [Paenibacillus uliginis N3/975]|uniref:Uncharacterized protein n=1 Tax=Paenibacillus uliginis N3/975 TaxID=1313296 RepID=A0A1X7HNA9_9BACL|nr:hypothetical protein SAMN05661091_4431 [Paenibacillus uliginis N3/975]
MNIKLPETVMSVVYPNVLCKTKIYSNKRTHTNGRGGSI